jgi:hypothetical protein
MHRVHTGDVRLPVRLRERPRFWPTFRSPLHEPAVAARIGRVLGICVLVCFGTGLLSHYEYHPWTWLPEPATPAWGYRLSQGVHVFTGIACIPLVLVKLWTVYPRLFAWPPARSVLHALERLTVAVLVATVLIELITGLLNILNWYPWPWDFVYVHYALAWVVAGSVLLHVAVKLDVIRTGLATPISGPAEAPIEPPAPEGRARATPGISRRGLLIAAAGGVGVITLTTVGQAASPLERFALLAPRGATRRRWASRSTAPPLRRRSCLWPGRGAIGWWSQARPRSTSIWPRWRRFPQWSGSFRWPASRAGVCPRGGAGCA